MDGPIRPALNPAHCWGYSASSSKLEFFLIDSYAPPLSHCTILRRFWWWTGRLRRPKGSGPLKRAYILQYQSVNISGLNLNDFAKQITNIFCFFHFLTCGPFRWPIGPAHSWGYSASSSKLEIFFNRFVWTSSIALYHFKTISVVDGPFKTPQRPRTTQTSIYFAVSIRKYSWSELERCCRKNYKYIYFLWFFYVDFEFSCCQKKIRCKSGQNRRFRPKMAPKWSN